MQLHGFDDSTPLMETASALTQVVNRGLVRYLGVSNHAGYQMAMLANALREIAGPPLVVSQPRYSLLDRGIEREVLPAAEHLGIGTMVYNPLAGGLLTGKYAERAPGDGARFSFGSAAEVYRRRYWHEDALNLVDNLRLIAARIGMPVAVLSMAWVLANRRIDVAIVGASAPGHVADAIRALEAPLADDVIAELTELSAPFRNADGVNAGLPTRR